MTTTASDLRELRLRARRLHRRSAFERFLPNHASLVPVVAAAPLVPVAPGRSRSAWHVPHEFVWNRTSLNVKGARFLN